MRHLHSHALPILSTFALFACSGESDCTRNATCATTDAAVSRSDAGTPRPLSARHNTRAEADAGAETDALAGGPGGEPETTADGGTHDSRDATPRPEGEPDSLTQDAGTGVIDDSAVAPSGDRAAPSTQNPKSEDPPIVVVTIPDRDAGAPDGIEAGAALGCVLGETRPCEGALGACAEGVEVCGGDGEFGTCSVQPNLVDSCDVDGDDSNCDGVPNDGCECTTGQQRACGPELAIGICRQGTSLCNDGVWGPCEGAVYPAARKCSSAEDNDCNGEPDDTLDGVCQCTEGSSQACDEHPGLDGVGPCAAGTSQCVVADDDSHAEWGACQGAVGPKLADSCDILGDDSTCNGVANQGCDFTPPVVVSSLPKQGATGVAEDADIEVVFSEPMDRASTEAAVTLSSATAFSFAWNDASTVLTVTPAAPFAYAEGDFADLDSISPRTYSLSIDTGAKDVSGNALFSATKIDFGTLRRIHQPLPLVDPDGAYSIVDFSGPIMSQPCGADLPVGYSPLYYVGIVTFDLSALPSNLSEVESVELTGNQSTIEGDPFGFAGALEVEHIWLPVGSAQNDGLTVDTLQDLGSLSNSVSPGLKSIDVTDAAAEDLALGTDRAFQSQYRLAFSRVAPPSDAQYVRFTCSSFQLDATYLVP